MRIVRDGRVSGHIYFFIMSFLSVPMPSGPWSFPNLVIISSELLREGKSPFRSHRLISGIDDPRHVCHWKGPNDKRSTSKYW
jgi:hypothetical protein